MKQPIHNIINHEDFESSMTLGEAIYKVFHENNKVFLENLQGSEGNYVRPSNIKGLGHAYRLTTRTARYDDNIDMLIDNAIAALSDWMPVDKELIEFIIDFETSDVSAIIGELVFLATSIEDYHSSAEGWRKDTIVQGLTTKQVVLPRVPVIPSSCSKLITSVLSYVMKRNTFILDQVERSDVLPLQVYTRLALLVMSRLCDCLAYGLFRASWRCEKSSFRATLSYAFRGINPEVSKAIDANNFTDKNFVEPVRNRLVQAYRDTFVRLMEFEKALNEHHIPAWYQNHYTKFYDAFYAAYQRARTELDSDAPTSLEEFFIDYANGRVDSHEED